MKRNLNKSKKPVYQYTHKQALLDYAKLTTEEKLHVDNDVKRCTSHDLKTRKMWFTEVVDVVMADRRAALRKKAA